jgi:hypothetical protein
MIMRYNVVIGRQEIPKTARGLVAYQRAIIGREGLLAAGMAIPMILLSVMVRLLPPWEAAAA